MWTFTRSVFQEVGDHENVKILSSHFTDLSLILKDLSYVLSKKTHNYTVLKELFVLLYFNLLLILEKSKISLMS